MALRIDLNVTKVEIDTIVVLEYMLFLLHVHRTSRSFLVMHREVYRDAYNDQTDVP